MNNKLLDIYIRARFTLLVMVTPEEERALELLKAFCQSTKRACITWDCAEGFNALVNAKAPAQNVLDPIAALDAADKMDSDVVLVFKDFHDFWTKPQVRRKLKNLAQRFKFQTKTIIITTPSNQIPDELKDDTVLIDFPLPLQPQLEDVLNNLTKDPNVKVSLTQLGREKILQAALGLSASQARRIFSQAIVSDGALDDRDIDLVTQQKKEIIRESNALEYYASHENPDDLGGLEVLKDWLKLRERAFTKEARDYGLPAPKGMALIGIPGTGKSLTAKTVAGLWKLPLLRLDVGALFGSLVGESEQRTRRALQLAETVAPCILWIDEMEKAFAQGALDGGTSTRVFGAILTWMQEKTAPCFVLATANNITQLPPELLRKGRFDEIFFLDLPTPQEREEIFAVHLRKRNRLLQDFDVRQLAAASQGYVGAEIEQAIIDAMYKGFDDSREFKTTDILDALKNQVPLSISQQEVIGNLREWLLQGRARSASFQAKEEAKQQFVSLQITPQL